jgi:tetratricopeptide (TPR) repeat protein
MVPGPRQYSTEVCRDGSAAVAIGGGRVMMGACVDESAGGGSALGTSCPGCRRALVDTVSGLCPSCLMRLGLDETDQADAEAFPPAAFMDWVRVKGSRIGQYELLDEIARGGMGIVYRARQLRPARVVALKVMLPYLASSSGMRARFDLEADAAAQLDHPGILPVYEVGHHDGLPYFSMKFAEGGSLAKRMPSISGDCRMIAVVMAKIARAVEHAHSRGILHRDLKPGNILFDANDEPQVADFGLAKFRAVDHNLTLPAAVLGSPNYIAPEQVTDRFGPVGPAADIYSLGAVLYEMLTGLPPFVADTALATLQLVPTQAPHPCVQVNPLIPAQLDAITLKCLEKEPRRRYASAGMLAEDLEQWLDGREVNAARQRTWRSRRNVAAAAAAVVVVVGAGAGFWAWTRSHPASYFGAVGQPVSPPAAGRQNQSAREAFLKGQEAFARATVDSFNAAVASFDEATRLDPASAANYAWKARSLIQLHSRYGLVSRDVLNSTAAAAIERALELDPQLAIAHLAEGERLAVQTPGDASIVEFQKAIAMDPALAPAHAALAWRHAMAGLYVQAEGEFRHAVELAPTDAAILSRFGRMLTRTGRVEDARELFSRAMTVDPNQPDAYYGAGELEKNAGGHFDRAARLLRRGLEIDPKSSRLAASFIGTLCELNALDSARTEIELTKVLGPQESSWLHEVAWCQIRSHDFASARATILAMELHDHESVGAVDLRAWSTGREPAAERALLGWARARFPSLFSASPAVDRDSIGAASVAMWMAADLGDSSLRDKLLHAAQRFFGASSDADKHMFPFYFALVSAYGGDKSAAYDALRLNLEPVPQTGWWFATDRRVTPLCDLLCGFAPYDDLARRSATAMALQAADFAKSSSF